MADRVIHCPSLFDRVAKKLRESMKVMTQSDVPDPVVIHPPCFVLFQSPGADQTHWLSSKKLCRTGETCGNPAITVWVRSVFHLCPVEKSTSRLIKFPDLDRS